MGRWHTTTRQPDPDRIQSYWYYVRDGTTPKPAAPLPKSDQQSSYTYMLTADVPHLFAVEYHLLSTLHLLERHLFPSALLDALAGCIHLIDVGG
ncbi:hypothetical protein SCLCIDRAFT_26160 [Scleroderma citrinum Foug A]|uniref:Uncharacterized protein n=1 Tax=Scleroderma citrinum Foug A TaxID=1036808 RepID=A0A0C3DJU2_9AGAM|nr:hypothetical protein SCLCIDRAFT_26160 [Scleroderma citrinum Foug A]